MLNILIDLLIERNAFDIIFLYKGGAIMLDLYKNIKARREELGMSQAELARRVGYTNRSTIARIERGDVDLSQSKIMEIAKALKISASTKKGSPQ